MLGFALRTLIGLVGGNAALAVAAAVSAFGIGVLIHNVRVAIWPPAPAVKVVAVDTVRLQRLEAQRDALLVAGAAKDETLHQRAVALNAMTAYLKDLEDELEKARGKSMGADAVVLPADDPWLRAWRQRGR